MTPVKTEGEVRRQRKDWPVGRVKGRESSDLGMGSGCHPLRDWMRDLRVSGLGSGLDPVGAGRGGVDGGGGGEFKVSLFRLLMVLVIGDAGGAE